MGLNEPIQPEVDGSHESDPEKTKTSELVKRAQNGDTSAIRELYLRHHEQIYRFIWSRGHDPVLADDLTGEVFLRMVANLPKYQDRALPFHAWLYRIARNLLVDHYRRNQKRETMPIENFAEEPTGGKSPEKTTELMLTFERVRQALEKLAPDQREVVELRFLAGLSLKEVALTIDKTVSAVKSLQHRGLSSLREKIDAQKGVL